MKVSKAGYNVLTTGNQNLSFSSDLATHQIYAVVSYSMSAGNTDEEYSHGLSYAPKCWVFLDKGTWFQRIPIMQTTTNGWDYYITNSVIHLHRPSTVATGNFVLVIFTRTFTP